MYMQIIPHPFIDSADLYPRILSSPLALAVVYCRWRITSNYFVVVVTFSLCSEAGGGGGGGGVMAKKSGSRNLPKKCTSKVLQTV